MKFFLVLMFFSVIFSGCSNKYETYLCENISEVREFMLEGKSDNISVNFIGGKRETDYVINGYSTDLIDFGVLTFVLDDVDNYDVSLANYVLIVGSVRYDGELQQNPFDGTLVVDIGKIIDYNQNVYAKLIIGDYSKEVKLQLVNKDFKINHNDVIKLVVSEYKTELSKIIEDGNFLGEVYIKIINDADENVGDYYWYINIVSRDKGNLSMLISPYTKEILAVNNNFK